MAAAADLARDGGEVVLPVGLAGTLAVPGGARALVVFAHRGESGRFSPRNRRVAAWLRQAELGTLMDLLTADEERIDRRTAELRFDIDLLAERLVAAADWLASEPRPETWASVSSGPAPEPRRRVPTPSASAASLPSGARSGSDPGHAVRRRVRR